jgi:hypothetical protein
MANTFKNKVLASVGASPQGYTTPASTTTTVIGMAVANRTANTIKVNAEVVDTSAGVTAYLVKDGIIAAGGNLIIVGGDQKVVLETTDVLRVSSDTASSADVVISMMETT